MFYIDYDIGISLYIEITFYREKWQKSENKESPPLHADITNQQWASERLITESTSLSGTPWWPPAWCMHFDKYKQLLSPRCGEYFLISLIKSERHYISCYTCTCYYQALDICFSGESISSLCLSSFTAKIVTTSSLPGQHGNWGPRQG